MEEEDGQRAGGRKKTRAKTLSSMSGGSKDSSPGDCFFMSVLDVCYPPTHSPTHPPTHL